MHARRACARGAQLADAVAARCRGARVRVCSCPRDVCVLAHAGMTELGHGSNVMGIETTVRAALPRVGATSRQHRPRVSAHTHAHARTPLLRHSATSTPPPIHTHTHTHACRPCATTRPPSPPCPLTAACDAGDVRRRGARVCHQHAQQRGEQVLDRRQRAARQDLRRVCAAHGRRRVAGARARAYESRCCVRLARAPVRAWPQPKHAPDEAPSLLTAAPPRCATRACMRHTPPRARARTCSWFASATTRAASCRACASKTTAPRCVRVCMCVCACVCMYVCVAHGVFY
jgi:hypothetical protein